MCNFKQQFLLHLWKNNVFFTEMQFDVFGKDCLSPLFWYEGRGPDKSCAPHICCNSCSVILREWLKGKKRSMVFAVPMVWQEPTNHVDDCYFCLTLPIKAGLSMKKNRNSEIPKSSICYLTDSTFRQLTNSYSTTNSWVRTKQWQEFTLHSSRVACKKS
jgi:hypothetical protein